MNHVNIVGRLTRDVELRATQSGKTLGRFSLAVNRKYAKDAQANNVDFIPCVIWGEAATTVEKYVKKGHKLGVDGRLETTEFENRDGQKVKTFYVIVTEFTFLEPKSVEVTQQPADGAKRIQDVIPGSETIENDIDLNDIPF